MSVANKHFKTSNINCLRKIFPMIILQHIFSIGTNGLKSPSELSELFTQRKSWRNSVKNLVNDMCADEGRECLCADFLSVRYIYFFYCLYGLHNWIFRIAFRIFLRTLIEVTSGLLHFLIIRILSVVEKIYVYLNCLIKHKWHDSIIGRR